MTGQRERRARPRTTEESRTTGLVQAIVASPRAAAAELERDVRAGGDWDVTLALLSAAEAMGRLRGLDLSKEITLIREQLRKARLQS